MGRGFKTLILYKLHNYRRNWTTTVDNLRQVAVISLLRENKQLRLLAHGQ
jgi:hypothetical protein